AILGVLSVYLIYLLGRRLFSKKAGLWAAAVYAVTLNGVYISRAGLQEPYVIFFFLLASYFFLKALDDKKYFWMLGAAIGLGALAKYNFFIVIPIFLTYLILFRRQIFWLKEFWLGLLAAVLIFSPVIIYNIELYRSAGHFDFQLSYLLGQDHPEWQIQPGKDIGSLPERLKNFIPRLVASNSWVFLSLVLISALFFVYKFIGEKKEKLPEKTFLALWLAFVLLLILLIGPSYRFLAMLTPFLALAAGFFLKELVEKINPPKFYFVKLRRVKYFGVIGLIIFLGFEIFYSYNNQIAYYPVGPTPWLSSKVRYENYNWGYNELGQWLENELRGKM
ncbi:MAG: glycosyltransferase family 39 protein, partial [Nitrospirota bacterium]